MRLLADNPPPDGAPPSLTTVIDAMYPADQLVSGVLQAPRTGARTNRTLSLADCREAQGCLFYQDCLSIPGNPDLRLRILRICHEAPIAGHPGRDMTYEALSCDIFWPTMREDAERFVANCHTCRRIKPHCHASFGALLPLPVPDHP